jgi:hypothetical protein
LSSPPCAWTTKRPESPKTAVIVKTHTILISSDFPSNHFDADSHSSRVLESQALPYSSSWTTLQQQQPRQERRQRLYLLRIELGVGQPPSSLAHHQPSSASYTTPTPSASPYLSHSQTGHSHDQEHKMSHLTFEFCSSPFPLLPPLPNPCLLLSRNQKPDSRHYRSCLAAPSRHPYPPNSSRPLLNSMQRL